MGDEADGVQAGLLEVTGYHRGNLTMSSKMPSLRSYVYIMHALVLCGTVNCLACDKVC
jgi:hypothetical protein